MSSEYVKLNHTPSLVRNGSFSRGLSHWFGCYVRHEQIVLNHYTPNVTTPRYAVTIGGASDDYYPSGVSAGLHQFVDYSNLSTYPSRRRIGGVRFVPVDTNKAFIHLNIAGGNVLSTVDGKTISAPGGYSGPGDTVPGSSYTPPDPIEGFFQHPLLYQDGNGEIPVTVGSEVPFADNLRTSTSGNYRAGKTVKNTPSSAGNLSYHALEVIDPLSRIAAIADSLDGRIATTTVEYVDATTATITITGDITFLQSVSRGLDTESYGLASGQIFRSYGTQEAAGRINNVSYNGDTLTLVVVPITTGPASHLVNLFSFFEDTGSLSSWKVFVPSIGTATVQKNTFDYNFTLVYSLRTTGSNSDLDDILLQMRVWDDGSVPNTFESFGPGYVGEHIPRFEDESIQLAFSNPLNPEWVRRVEHFFREAGAPLSGRLLLSLVPAVGSTVVLSDVRLYVGDHAQAFSRSNISADLSHDLLRASVDHLETIIPAGVVVLYAGGGTCPAGYKRVDGFGSSEGPGTSYYDIPVPSEVVYDSETDRTTMVWSNSSFPIYDAYGNERSIEEMGGTLRFTIPGSSVDVSVPYAPPQQAMHPGTFVRVPEFSASPAILANTLISSGAFSANTYTGVYEDRARSFLVTDVSYEVNDSITYVAPSSIPYDATTTVQGHGGIGTITYPYFINVANGIADTSIEDMAFVPLGPVGRDQDLEFTFGSGTSVVTGVVTAYIPQPHAGSAEGTEVTIKSGTLNNYFTASCRVGDVYYFSWSENASTGNHGRKGAFIGRIIHKGTTNQDHLRVLRYDGRLRSNEFENIPSAGSRTIDLEIRPVKLFGLGPQIKDGSTVGTPGIKLARITVAATGSGSYVDYWVAYPSVPLTLTITVKGNVKLPTGIDSIQLQPSGYLKSSTPSDQLDYGSGGHTHLVGKVQEAITVENLVPRVNEKSSKYNVLPWTPVPSAHHHGYLPEYRWPLPQFALFTLCEKL